jgi:hypothetical protein
MKHLMIGLAALLLLTACDDKAMVNIYKKKITQTPISCMKLNIFPEEPMISSALNTRYHFSDNCDLILEVSYKSGIKCNSRFNVANKSTTNFPSSYLKMELRRGMTLQYSYYIDLTKKPTEDDVNRGFDRIERDLKIVSKVR